MPRPGRPGTAEPAGGQRWLVAVAGLAVLWFAATMLAAYRTIVGSPADDVLAMVQTAITLPTVVVAAALAGAGAAFLGCSLLPTTGGSRVARRLAAHPVAARTVTGVVVGAVVGAVAVGLVLAGYGSRPIIVAAATTIGLAALAGGALGTLRPAVAVVAGLCGSLAVVVIGFVRGSFTGVLTAAAGSGSTVGSRLTAHTRVELMVSLISGVTAGLVAFWYLRRAGSRRWTAHLLAGGFPGLLLLLTEVGVRLVGHRVTAAAAGTSEVDRAALEYLADGRLNHALVVFFAGAVTALLALGRTLGPRSDP